jgi:dTDP-4-amino-4,6-dideoxygalactose transaminase
VIIALRCLGVSASDEVVLPSYVCRSVLEAVQAAGAEPVFADIDNTLHVSRASVEAVLTPRTRCVIVPHLFGNTAPVDEIWPMLESRGIVLIDDAAQGLGAIRGGRPVGSFGHFGVVCGGAAKPLATPAGGCLMVDDPKLHGIARKLELQPESVSRILNRTAAFWIWRRMRRYTLLVKNLRDRVFGNESDHVNAPRSLSNLDAALMHVQFGRLRENAEVRRQNALTLLRILEPLGWTCLTDFDADSIPLKLVLLLPEASPDLSTVVEAFAGAGIECQSGYRPCHLDLRDRESQRLPVTEALWGRVICLPIEMPLRDSRPLCGAVRRLVQENRGSQAVSDQRSS